MFESFNWLFQILGLFTLNFDVPGPNKKILVVLGKRKFENHYVRPTIHI